MKFLILGGNGYLGSKIIKHLLNIGHSITCTKRKNSDLTKLFGFEDYITIIPASATAVETALIYQKFDWILNMVCNYGRDTVLYDNVIESNIEFPLSVLNLAVKYDIANYMTIGTGLPAKLNMYSFSKNLFSSFGEFYAEKHGINFINMRLEMFYGSDEPKDRFIPNCIIKMLHNEDIDLTFGTQKRDIVSVDDVIGAILCVLDSDLKGFHEIAVGTGEAPSIKNILIYIKEETGSMSNLNFGSIPARIGEPDCIADITELKKIGYKCKYEWKQGLKKMIKEIVKNEIID